MKKSFKKYFLSFAAMAAVAFASVDSLYEIDGSAFNERHKTKGPKALVNVGRSMGKDNIAIERHDPHIGYITQDSIHISLKKSEQWIEMEKIPLIPFVSMVQKEAFGKSRISRTIKKRIIAFSSIPATT